ncbi:MAG: HNH endonuclease [Chitinophagaceae bacterium]|nr:HNH endonuclease [Chitinophagaceae bacterium]
MTRISLEKIVDAFIFHKPTLKMQDIKDYIFENRGHSFEGYKTRYSFDQTIQKIVETHCATKKGFNGKPVFESPERGYYQLTNPQYWIDLWQIESIDDKILKVNSTNQTEDLEITTRTLREINIINRNKNLVQSLKALYDNTCQLCRTQLKIADNLFYSEVHHIKSLGEPHNGPDTATNMIVVCPNCHVLLDFKAIEISKEKLNTKEPHKVDIIYIDYHNDGRP